MSEPSAHKRVKQSAVDPVAAKAAMKAAVTRAHVKVSRILRATKRAEERWQAAGRPRRLTQIVRRPGWSTNTVMVGEPCGQARPCSGCTDSLHNT
jgi:hypothetical protein